VLPRRQRIQHERIAPISAHNCYDGQLKLTTDFPI
jgi:hypothetical protein